LGSVIYRLITSSGMAAAGAVVVVVFSLMAAFPNLLASANPGSDQFGRSLAPSLHHLLGTTAYGQDIWSQLVWGTRESLVIAVLVGLLTTVLSVAVGVSMAYFGGFTERWMALVTDVLLVIPTLPLIIVIVAYVQSASFAVLVAVLTVTGWSWGARQLRPEAMARKNREFLQAAKVRGERGLYIVVVEILPTMTSLIMAIFLGSAAFAILAASGLQYIGLGDPTDQSWGTMLYWASNNSALTSGSPLWEVMPGICIALLGTAFSMLSYAFDEVTNPALRRVRRRRGGGDADS
jgi:peptide/nickel transport system permease protein